ncbi:Aste57867_23380 [Aphanomyces stellatus]|uniref:Aste57867_23380 protein n=1 Tax=Aphanomyces stellatus TaxID=120398 RepID=A0A485LML9_9STRA|nr:hypothetical protein As57867_023309 [Aphanomyces stellatus]VFU00026.1 Aste57867_23380 [Aphanomyces stellatus]
MRQVRVVLHDGVAKVREDLASFVAWMPPSYSIAQVISDALHHWNLPLGCTCALYDDESNVVTHDATLDHVPSTAFDLVVSPDKRRSVARGSASDRVLELFLVHALQNPWGQGLRINWQQFKGLTRWIVVHPRTQVGWDTQKMLAFHSHATSTLGLTYTQFLEAWVDVSGYVADVDDLYIEILDTMTKSSLVNTLARLRLHDAYADAAVVAAARAPFAKSLVLVLGAFHHAVGTPPSDQITLTFAEFRSFVAAVHLKKRLHVSMDELACLFVHCCRLEASHVLSGHVQVPLGRLVWALTHIGLLVMPRLMALSPAATETHLGLLSRRALAAQYAATCFKIVIQEIAQALSPRDIDAIGARQTKHGAAFRRGAQLLHRAFVTCFQTDGCVDYVAACRVLAVQPTDNQKPVVAAQNFLPDRRQSKPHHPLDAANDLLDAIVLEVLDTDEPDWDFIADQWVAATDAVDSHLASQIDDTSSLFRYASSLSVFAQQLWSTSSKTLTLLPLALEAARTASTKCHAYWAHLCVSEPTEHEGDAVLQCLLLWAHCLGLTGDMLSAQSTNETPVDAALAASLLVHPPPSNQKIEFWSVPSDATPAVHFNEARLRYLVAIDLVPSSWETVLSFVVAQIQLALHLPLGVAIAKELFHDAVDHLSEFVHDEAHALVRYVDALLFVRHSFLEPTHVSPFYQFIVASIFQDFCSTGAAALSIDDMNRINHVCHVAPVTPATAAWLLTTFESTHDEPPTGLSEAGLLQYFTWMAHADPVEFHRAMKLLTAKYSGAQGLSRSCLSSIVTYHRTPPRHAPQGPQPLAPRRPRLSHKRDTFPAFALDALTPLAIADCFVVLSGVLAAVTPTQLQQTTSASDLRIHVQITDKLYHPNCRSFRVPDEIATFLYPTRPVVYTAEPAPRWFDTVLTDVKGSKTFASCLQFAQATTPSALRALLSEIEGVLMDSAAFPTWVTSDAPVYYIPKCLCFLSRQPVFKSLHIALLEIFRSQSIQSKMIASFLDVPVPLLPSEKTRCVFRGHSFLLSPLANTADAYFSPHEIDFTLVFHRLSLAVIVDILTYLMCEKKVALASTSYGMLTPIAETLRALLHPFRSQVVYVPVVPEGLGDLLCSPVPFLVGISADLLRLRHELDDVIFVDVDTNTLYPPLRLPLPRSVWSRDASSSLGCRLGDRTKKKLVKSLGAMCERATIAVRDDRGHVDDAAHDVDDYGVIDASMLAVTPQRHSLDDDAWHTAQCVVDEHIEDMWTSLQSIVSTFFLSYAPPSTRPIAQH